MQTAGGLIGLAAELAAGMQDREDHFQRGFVRELLVLIDRNAAAIVADRQGIIGGEFDLDPAGITGDRLVHRVVEHLCGEMVQRPRIGAADIHAGPPAYRLQPFQNFDILGGIVAGLARIRVE